MTTIRSESGHGSGRRITLLTTENSATLAPRQSASVSPTVTVKPRFFQSSRSATRRSWPKLSMWSLDGSDRTKVVRRLPALIHLRAIARLEPVAQHRFLELAD